MAFIKKPPVSVERTLQLEKPVSDLLDEYCRFVDCTHESEPGCAVQAALAVKLQGARARARIALLLERILPGLQDIGGELTPQEQLGAAVEANLRWSMHQLLDTPEGRARMAEGVLKLVGAIYELKTGHVRFLS